MDIVCFGQQNWDVCWTSKQQLMTRLAARGHRVLYVDPVADEVDLSPSGLVSFWGSGKFDGALRQMGSDLWVLRMRHWKSLPKRLNHFAERWLLQRVAASLCIMNPVSFALTPFRPRLQDCINPFARIYYAVDEWTAYYGTPEERKEGIRREEEAVLRQADVALAVSPRLLERFRLLNPRSYLQENGADTAHFSPHHLSACKRHPLLADIEGPVLGFIGQVDHRIDQHLLSHIASQRPDWQIVLAGRVVEGADYSALRKLPNIHFTGYIDYAELPSILKCFDVCLVPYAQNELTHSCNPLKVYEYLSSGKPVVSTNLDGLNSCRDVVAVARDKVEFLTMCEEAFCFPEKRVEERIATAVANSWERRVDELLARLEEALQIGSARENRSRVAVHGAPALRREVRLDSKEDCVRRLRREHHYAPMIKWQRLFYGFTRAAGWGFYNLRVAGRFIAGGKNVRVRRILIARRGCLGDMIVFGPTIAALRRKFPDAKIVLGVSSVSPSDALFAGSNDIDEVRVLNFMSCGSRIERLGGALTLFREGYDLLITGISYFMISEAFYCGAPVMMSLFDDHPLHKYTNRFVPLDLNRHEADNNLALAEALGAKPTPKQRIPQLAFRTHALESVWNDLNRDAEVPAPGSYFVVHPGAKLESRRWPVEKFARLIVRLLDEYSALQAVITGTPQEELLGDGIVEEIPPRLRGRVKNLMGRTGLHGLTALIDNSRAVLCNDTGVMHLARARAKPLLALLGPENDVRWGPYPVGYAPAIGLRHETPCGPCLRDKCDNHYCMKLLGVDEAYDAVKRMMLLEFEPTSPQNVFRAQIDKKRYSWRELANAGHVLPTVTAVIHAGSHKNAESLLESLASQDYPVHEAIIVCSEGFRADGAVDYPFHVRALRMDENANQWQLLAGEIRSEYGFFCSPDDVIEKETIGANIGALLRSPAVMGARHPALLDIDDVRRAYGECFRLVTMSRATLETILFGNEAMEVKGLLARDSRKHLMVPRIERPVEVTQ